jgi:dTDP-L-rhamnose 4-epimerase
VQQVLVTGGCGFIGRQVCRELLSSGYRVRVLDALIEQVHGSGGGKSAPAGVDFVSADIRDKQAVAAALEGVDGVVHLAAEVGVGQSMYEIARYVGANDLGTAVLLECLIDRSVQRLVVASSMSVYGEGLYLAPDGQRVGNVRRSIAQLKAHDWQPRTAGGEALEPAPTDESKPIDLASIYALTKYAQERAVLIFGEAYAMETVALRLFNVFGPGQALANPYTGVLANFASRLANGAAPTLFEDGLQKRDFVHVKDVARAFRLALEQPQAPGHTINIGSGRSYAIRDVALMLADAMDVDVAPEITGRFRSGDIRNCFADISKAREILGFDPRYRLEDSLVELADWVRQDGAVDRGEEMRQHLESRGLVI